MGAAANLILVAFAVAGLSVTTSKAHVTAPLRAFVKRQSNLFGYMMECPYCLSHWFAFGFWLIMPRLGIGPIPDFFISVFGTVAAAALITGSIMHIMLWHEAEVEALRNENDLLRASLKQIVDGEPHSPEGD